MAHHQFFWNNGSTSLDHSSKIEKNVFPSSPPFQVIYMGVELWGKPYGITPRCYWEHVVVHIGNMMGTRETIQSLRTQKLGDFCSLDFDPEIKKSTKSLHKVQVASPKKKERVHQNLPSYLDSSHIWLHFAGNHHHFGYIIKLTQKKKDTGNCRGANISLVCSHRTIEQRITTTLGFRTLTFNLARMGFLQVSRESHVS